MDMKICQRCKKECEETISYCPYCGNSFETSDGKAKLSLKSKLFLMIYITTTFILLAIGLFTTFQVQQQLISECEVISPDEFSSYIEKNMECELIDDFQNKEGITFAQYTQDSCPIRVEYIIYSDRAKEQGAYQNMLKNLEDMEPPKTVIEKNFSPYYEYTLQGEAYYSVRMMDNTILYVETSLNHKADAIKIINDLGYDVDIKIDYWILVGVATAMMLILFYICLWKLMIKFGKPGWVGLIPIYNFLILSEKLFGKKWYGIFYLVLFLNCYGIFIILPIMAFIFYLISAYRLGKVFGRDTIGSVLLVLFPFIFVPILAFDNSCYRKA